MLIAQSQVLGYINFMTGKAGKAMTYYPSAKSKLAMPLTVDAGLYSSIGRYAGAIVLTVFENIGGIEAMSDWAAENPGDFYTKSFGKIITIPKQVEHRTDLSIEDAVRILDAQEGVDYDDITPGTSFAPMSDPSAPAIRASGNGSNFDDFENLDNLFGDVDLPEVPDNINDLADDYVENYSGEKALRKYNRAALIDKDFDDSF